MRENKSARKLINSWCAKISPRENFYVTNKVEFHVNNGPDSRAIHLYVFLFVLSCMYLFAIKIFTAIVFLR